MIEVENLNTLSDIIENEIHATHSISDETYRKIQDVVEATDAKLPLNVRDSHVKLILSLNPLSFKMFQYLIATMENVIPEARRKVIKHVANVVLAKSFKYFPNNTDIYIAYSLRRIIDDRERFIQECMEDKVINVENKSQQARNFSGWLLMLFVLVVITAIVAVMRRMYINKDIVDERKKRGRLAGINYIVPSIEVTKAELKKKLKSVKKQAKELKAIIKNKTSDLL